MHICVKDCLGETLAEVVIYHEDCDFVVSVDLNNDLFIWILQNEQDLISDVWSFKECLFSLRYFLQYTHHDRVCREFAQVCDRVHDLINDYACKLDLRTIRD